MSAEPPPIPPLPPLPPANDPPRLALPMWLGMALTVVGAMVEIVNEMNIFPQGNWHTVFAVAGAVLLSLGFGGITYRKQGQK